MLYLKVLVLTLATVVTILFVTAVIQDRQIVTEINQNLKGVTSHEKTQPIELETYSFNGHSYVGNYTTFSDD